MKLNWVGYQYRDYDGYGRFAIRMIQALQRHGVEVEIFVAEQLYAPQWMQRQMGFDPNLLTISLLPPFYGARVETTGNAEHWLWTMTEGSKWPTDWHECVDELAVDRVIVPSVYCQEAITPYAKGAPVHVVLGGTDPAEFPMRNGAWHVEPYTFLALADRGARKGWIEVYDAFWKAFGTVEQTPDVRLIIKARPNVNHMLDIIAPALDPRISIWEADCDSPAEMFDRCHVFAAPSRGEGWGMPHREAAMMAVLTITQRYSGLDDGYTDCWSIPVTEGHVEPIPEPFEHIEGEWHRADIEELANIMRLCYDNPDWARELAVQHSLWLRQNQTWDHAAENLIALMKDTGQWQH